MCGCVFCICVCIVCTYTFVYIGVHWGKYIAYRSVKSFFKIDLIWPIHSHLKNRIGNMNIKLIISSGLVDTIGPHYRVVLCDHNLMSKTSKRIKKMCIEDRK